MVTLANDPIAPSSHQTVNNGLLVREHFASLALQSLLTHHGAANLRVDGVYLRDLPSALEHDRDGKRAQQPDEYAQRMRTYWDRVTAHNRLALARESVAMADALISALNETPVLTPDAVADREADAAMEAM